MTTHNDHITLVLGATGKTGRRIAQRLDQRGVAVRRGSRAGEPKFDWDNHATWAPALQGMSAAYVSFFPDVAVPGAPETIAEFAQLAVKLGARRLVLLSGRGETEAQRAEQALQASGADWTVVRCSWFMQNFSESFLLDPVLAGEVALPVGTVGEPFVDAEDIADVATAALTEDGHAGELYELTGPRLLTFEQAVAEIADATWRPIRYVPITVDEYAAAMSADGLPGDVVSLIAYLFTEVLDGRNAKLADGVQRALARPPRDFADYAHDAAASGAWNAP